MKEIEITMQHYNSWDPECGIEFTCTNCWKVCLRGGDNYCPQCGVKLKWTVDFKELAKKQMQL